MAEKRTTDFPDSPAKIIEEKKLVEEITSLKKQDDKLREKSYQVMFSEQYPIQYRRRLLWKQIERRENRLKTINELGLSTREITALKQELRSFKTERFERGLGTRDYLVSGFSKVLNARVRIHYMRMTLFMRNVKGMASLAGETVIYSIRKI